MKDRKTLFAVLSILMSLVSVSIGEEQLGIEFTADFMSKYIWRGQNLSDDSVFEPGLTLSYENLSASIWGNMDLTNINGNSGDFSEVDYSLDYSVDFPGIEGLGYSIGLIYYDFPGTTVKDTTEVYWGFSLDCFLSPSITIYHDVDEAEGSYVSLSAGHSIENIFEIFPEVPVGMDIGASLGWGSGSYDKYYWGTGQSKLQDLVLSMSFPIAVGDWTIAPSINYATLVSDDIRDTDAYGTDSDFFFAGVSLSKSF